MADVSVSLIICIGLTFFLAGIVKGTTGMGLPTLSMAVLGAIMSPAAAAALLIVPSFVTKVWQLVTPARASSRSFGMMLAIVLGTVDSTMDSA